MTNTTVTGNAATATGDAGCGDCAGGGIRIKQGTMTLTNSSITGNSAVLEGGGFAASSGAVITLINTTITGNSAAMDPDCSYIIEQAESGC